MDVAILSAAILVGAIFVAAPLYRGPAAGRRGTGALGADEREGGLTAARRALHDLEVDLATGLIDQASYERERSALQAHRRRDD